MVTDRMDALCGRLLGMVDSADVVVRMPGEWIARARHLYAMAALPDNGNAFIREVRHVELRTVLVELAEHPASGQFPEVWLNILTDAAAYHEQHALRIRREAA